MPCAEALLYSWASSPAMCALRLSRIDRYARPNIYRGAIARGAPQHARALGAIDDERMMLPLVELSCFIYLAARPSFFRQIYFRRCSHAITCFKSPIYRRRYHSAPGGHRLTYGL